MKHEGSDDDVGRRTFGRVLTRIGSRNWPTAVHVIGPQRGESESAEVGVLDWPRFSVCLSRRAKYWVMREGKLEELTLRRGEAVFVAARGMMEPHPEGRYLALGVVFANDLTRFLLARKHPVSSAKGAKRGHRFLMAHHSRWVMDSEVNWMVETLVKHGSRLPEDDYLCGLLRLLMVKAKEGLVKQTEDGVNHSRARFSWRAACHFVQEHLQEGIDRADVARFLQLHPNHVSRLFSQFGGESFNAYLVKARLQRAQRLLADPAVNVSQVARACGFSEANYFIRCYKRAFGVTPGMRNRNQKHLSTSS